MRKKFIKDLANKRVVCQLQVLKALKTWI